ncbi:MAG: nuclear transport factor 2 family protein [Arachnia sp.]
MYRRIIRARIRGVFERINSGDYMAMVDALAPRFEYHFHGDHALGGRRTTRAAMIRWWQRLVGLMPGIHFDVREVIVNGGPWRTRVAVRAVVTGELADGSPYTNIVVQFLTLAWGKVASVESLEDLQILERSLSIAAENGLADALAEPICDEGSRG